MPFISKIQRQSDYNLFDSNTPLVIDNGASYFRIGWAGESEPRVVFRNLVQRPRHKVTGETVTIVGDHDPALLKYFDCTRSGPRSAFDSNVVYQFETMEYILDFGFDRMGANGTEIDHPVLITECVCNPVQSRSKMAELLFETYGVPSIAFGVDVAFSYKYNQQQGVCAKDCLALCPGFNTTHVIPFVDGEPVYEGCCRTNVGGFHVTDHLKQLLSLKYPYHLARFTWEKVEDLKMEHCYIAPDYVSEVRLFQKGAKEAEEKTRCWQLPWVPPPIEEPPSEEEIARKAAIKEKQGQRLREMAEAKRSSKINELENELHGLEFLFHQLEQVEESKVLSFLAETGYGSRQEIESARNKVMQSLRKAKGEPKNEQDETEKVDPAANEKYSLINIPDDMLTQEQLNEKKKQLSLKSMAEGRQRLKQKRHEEELERERKQQLEEEKRLENPELYLEQLHARYKDLSERLDQQKRLKTNGGHSNGNNLSGGVGRGERLNAAQRERMRLLTTAAFDRGKGEDTFGARDEDWQLYKLMSKDYNDDDEGPDEEEAELACISSRLQDLDPTFIPKLEAGISQPAELKSAPGGSELLAGVGDDSGFTFATKTSLSTAPQSAWDNPMFTGAVGVDYAGNKVENVVRVGNTQGTRQVAISNNGGVSWNVHNGASTSQSGGSIAYSADADVIIWSSGNQRVLRSQNQGSFTSVSSVPSGAVIASDKRNNKYFYAASGSTFYVSSNQGSSFSQGGSLSSVQSIRDIAVHPTKAGDVWVSTDAGIFHSTDFGSSFSKVSSSLSNTYQIALGRGSGSTWNVYAFGTGSAGAKLYGSADQGKTWSDIQGSIMFGAIDSCRLEGSGNNAGQVYVGTNGRGVFWAQGSVA